MKGPSSTGVKGLRWWILSMIFVATTINYVDRQVLSVLQKTLQDTLHFSNAEYGRITGAFLLAYAVFHPLAGRFIDAVGIRIGFFVAVTVWSVAACSHALAGFAADRTVDLFGHPVNAAVLILILSRFALGLGEAGHFPASIKLVAEWFPRGERAFATGIFNAGTNVGAMIAPAVVYVLVTHVGWQGAFVFTGITGFLWVALWLALYRRPSDHPRLTQAEYAHIHSDADSQAPASAVPYSRILSRRQTWGFIVAKAMTDPVWWFFLFWLPGYLSREKGFTLAALAAYLWIPYLFADFGSVGGGWLSSWWIKRGWTVDRARKGALLCAAACMPAAILALRVDHPVAVMCLIGVACAGHQAWSANLFTLTSDTFPKSAVGSVVGLGQTGGAAAGFITTNIIGVMVDRIGYAPIFGVAGIMHLTAFVFVCLIFGRIAPISFTGPRSPTGA